MLWRKNISYVPSCLSLCFIFASFWYIRSTQATSVRASFICCLWCWLERLACKKTFLLNQFFRTIVVWHRIHIRYKSFYVRLCFFFFILLLSFHSCGKWKRRWLWLKNKLSNLVTSNLEPNDNYLLIIPIIIGINWYCTYMCKKKIKSDSFFSNTWYSILSYITDMKKVFTFRCFEKKKLVLWRVVK